MIRIALGIIAFTMGLAIYRLATIYGEHTAWLVLLAFGTGALFGLIFWLEFGAAPTPQTTEQPRVVKKS